MVVHLAICDRCEEAGAELAADAALCRRGAEFRARWESLELGGSRDRLSTCVR